ASGEAYFAERQRLEALTLVLERRLRNRLREELSGTYGVSVVGQTYQLSGERFRVQIGFDAAPERNMELRREMLAVLEGVREEGASEEELERVVRHQRRLLETRLESNRYWLEQMTLYTRLGLPLEGVVSPYPLSRITPEELKEAAARYLPSDAYYLFSYMPKREVMEADEARRRGGGEAGEVRLSAAGEESGPARIWHGGEVGGRGRGSGGGAEEGRARCAFRRRWNRACPLGSRIAVRSVVAPADWTGGCIASAECCGCTVCGGVGRVCVGGWGWRCGGVGRERCCWGCGGGGG